MRLVGEGGAVERASQMVHKVEAHGAGRVCPALHEGEHSAANRKKDGLMIRTGERLYRQKSCEIEQHHLDERVDVDDLPSTPCCTVAPEQQRVSSPTSRPRLGTIDPIIPP